MTRHQRQASEQDHPCTDQTSITPEWGFWESLSGPANRSPPGGNLPMRNPLVELRKRPAHKSRMSKDGRSCGSLKTGKKSRPGVPSAACTVPSVGDAQTGKPPLVPKATEDGRSGQARERQEENIRYGERKMALEPRNVGRWLGGGLWPF